MPYCPNCGALLKPGERYCFTCGTKVVPAVESQGANQPFIEPIDEQTTPDREDIPPFKGEDYGPEEYENDEAMGETTETEYPNTQRVPPRNNMNMNRQQFPPQEGMPPRQPHQQAPALQPQIQPQVPVKQKTGILSIIARILEIIFYLGLIVAVGVGIYLLYQFAGTVSFNPMTP
ncbi:MAG: zinc ribbon domain-containing protein [archaeon]